MYYPFLASIAARSSGIQVGLQWDYFFCLYVTISQLSQRDPEAGPHGGAHGVGTRNPRKYVDVAWIHYPIESFAPEAAYDV